MTEKASGGGDKLKVFVSYSRRDLDFADQIVAVLSWQGFLPVIDRKGIHGAENWKQRLGQLILESEIVVFVLSPDSAASEICGWEVEEAVRRGKRIIPILCRPLEDQVPHDILRDLNYIHFYADEDLPGSGFGTGLVRFIEALSVDMGWLREHTRLEELAARWDDSDRDTDLLVRGSELEACNSWRDRRPANASELTVLQRDFLAASDEQEAARANTERRRLEEVGAAQNARHIAIEEREAAVERELEAQNARARAVRIIAWGSTIGAAIIVIGALVFVEKQRKSTLAAETAQEEAQTARVKAVKEQKEAEKQRKLADTQKKKLDLLIGRVRVGRDRPAGIKAMKKVCNEAIAVTSKLATTNNKNEYNSQKQRFRELYFGPMNVMELWQKTDKYADSLDSEDLIDSVIEEAMVAFNNELMAIERLESTDFPRESLTQLSSNILEYCRDYLP